MPTDTNYMMPMIFGGRFAAELDLCAAAHVTKLLAYCSPDGPDSAVTHKLNITFHAAAYMGDLIRMESSVKELRKKAISLHIKAYRQSRSFRHAVDDSPAEAFIAEAEVVFIAKKDGLFVHHGLTF
jgi:acyl-CoA hydrolase